MAQEEKIMRGNNNNMVGSSTGYNCYSDDPHVSSSGNPNTSTSFEANPLEIFNFEPQSSVNHSSVLFWKGPSPSSSSKAITAADQIAATGDFYQFDESSLQRCVFPCEPSERPSQGLSLSLSSTNPSTIQIQPFELIRPQHQQDQSHHQGYFGKSIIHEHQQQQQEMMTDQDGGGGGGGGGAHYNHHHQSAQYNIRSSRYLVPAQELLNEFCNLGTKQSDHSPKGNKAPRGTAATTSSQWQDDDNNMNATSSKNKSLYSLEFLDLQKRKSKLLQMLEEVDRRYKHYCDQMKSVVSSFEAVAGNGAATVYSALASKAMSRHFRCLRDGIVGQIKATKKAMGEKDIAAPGTTRGETPRLRLLDQTLRQQRAFQQMTMMDSHPWRPQRGLPERSVSVLRAWLFEHFLHPYPSDVDKHILARQTGLSRSQVSNWFINARVRLWKPMVEEMYMEETKANQENMEGTSDGFNAALDQNNANLQMDQKPTPDQLVRIDSECLSSIINNPEKIDHHHHHHAAKAHDHEFQQSFARVTDSFGAVELDFSSYNHHHHHQHHNFGGGPGGSGGGVSLTLGLQQHGGGGGSGGAGVSLAFSPTTQGSLFYPRDHMEDCQNAVQYSSLLEGDQGQNLPYRNLMGAQLLHDLAG